MQCIKMIKTDVRIGSLRGSTSRRTMSMLEALVALMKPFTRWHLGSWLLTASTQCCHLQWLICYFTVLIKQSAVKWDKLDTIFHDWMLDNDRSWHQTLPLDLEYWDCSWEISLAQTLLGFHWLLFYYTTRRSRGVWAGNSSQLHQIVQYSHGFTHSLHSIIPCCSEWCTNILISCL